MSWVFTPMTAAPFGPASLSARMSNECLRLGHACGGNSSSNQGLVWDKITGLPTSSDLYAIDWASAAAGKDANFVAAGSFGTVARSLDGFTWTVSSIPGGMSTVYAIANLDNNFVVGGASGGIATSNDGITWVYSTNLRGTAWGTSAAVRALIWVSGLSNYYAFGDSGKMAYSNNGTTWTFVSSFGSVWGTTATAYAAAQGAGVCCVVGGSTQVVTSPLSNMSTWTFRYASSPPLYAIAWSGSVFCAVGANGTVITSPDGITWTNRTGLSSTGWGTTACRGITWTDSRFCVVGDGGKVAISADGITWTYVNTLVSAPAWGAQPIYGIVWNGNSLVACGGSGAVATFA